jgi:hypothetical protein
MSWEQWGIPVIPAFRNLKEDSKFEACLDYIVIPYLKNKKRRQNPS